MLEPDLNENFFNHYKDTGCSHAPKCLSCHLPKCIHDEPRGKQGAGEARRDAERSDAVLLARKTMGRKPAALKVAKDYGVTERTIHRVMQRMGL